MLLEKVTECVTLLLTDAGIIIGPGCGLFLRRGETADWSADGLAASRVVTTEIWGGFWKF